ncbi:hypothetical protein O3P69_017705 [Scylla paramamosain]|uniref:Uncharacterized protein n=1 Tax=Scylla paramamosain TaxID=85552 RepID=A0AAW0U0J2_SCYPA
MAARVLLVVAALVALVSCERGYSGGGGRFSGAALLNDQRSQNAYGEYSFQYETSDGTFRQEEGAQNNGQVSRGRYAFTSPEGQPVEIAFTADHGGFQPSGAVLPVPPQLPYQRVQAFNH